MKPISDEYFNRIVELSKTNISKRYAASILHNEGFSNSVEAARSVIRSHTLANGSASRFNKDRIINWSSELPQPDKSEFAIKTIDCEKGIGCLFDIHLPFHDLNTINAFIERGNEYDVIILQEVFDFYGLSKFDKTRIIRPAQEQETFFQFMDYFRNKLPDHRIIFQHGNHDERYKLYLYRHAQAIADMQGLSFGEIMAFDDFGIELLPEKNLLKYRKLHIGHGHELGIRGAAISPARTFYLKTGGNYIGGHVHKIDEYIERNINDEIKGAWSVGCACDLHPLFMPVNKWNNGYAIIKPYKEELFHVDNVKLF